ncbi:MAG: hypothetical protein BWY17_04726 [Deltaproteobacteria bacterium ADurb.Bin207]|nr:MAG: hypothetical protein BWY17_04726 [Deltaproteobacteria bacterium ADurb.Bin207]
MACTAATLGFDSERGGGGDESFVSFSEGASSSGSRGGMDLDFAGFSSSFFFSGSGSDGSSSAEGMGVVSAGDGLGGSASFLGSSIAAPISSSEPPAPLRASASSSAACFITVRSSGGGISFSLSVLGKNPPSAGLSSSFFSMSEGNATAPSPSIVAFFDFIGAMGAGSSLTAAGLSAAGSPRSSESSKADGVSPFVSTIRSIT